MALADSVASCQVGAAAQSVDIVAATTVAINPARILLSAGLAHSSDSSFEHSKCWTLQTEVKEEGGYAFGSQTSDGAQTPAGQRLSQALTKEAVTARHAHQHPCCAPCPGRDITGFFRTSRLRLGSLA